MLLAKARTDAVTSIAVRRANHSFLDHAGFFHQELAGRAANLVERPLCPALSFTTPNTKSALPTTPKGNPISAEVMETRGRRFEARKPRVETAVPTATTRPPPSARILVLQIPTCQTPTTISPPPSIAKRYTDSEISLGKSQIEYVGLHA